MKSKASIFGAVLVGCGIAAALLYVNADALESALASANTHTHGTGGSQSGPRDHFSCHRHGAATYHCH